MPTVSVIVPTYDRAALLPRSLQSVLNQTREDFELLVVDDASRDDTRAVVQAFQDDRIVYLRQSSRQGAAAARNAGIRAAKGRYVAFLDSDDSWLPTKLECQLAKAEQSTEPNERVVYYTQTIKNDGDRQVVRPRRGKRSDESIASYVFCANLDINTIVVLMPTTLAREVMFLETSQTHEEVDFFMRLEAAGARFEFFPQPLSVYYCDARPDRMSASSDITPSIQWHDSVASYFTPRATRGFRAKVIAPRVATEGKWWLALGIILSALFTASIRFDDALKYLAESLLPASAHRKLLALAGGKARPRVTQ